jgi:hypothetical protein
MLTTKRRPSRLISGNQRFSRSNMQKSSVGPLVAGLVLVVLAAIYGYMYFQVNSQEKKMTELQTVIAKDSQTVSGVVNFINTSLSGTQNK